MAFPTTANAQDPARNRGLGPGGTDADSTRTLGSAVSWGAVAAGAASAAALSLILLILGVGLGLSSVSPWASEGINASSFGMSTILWLTLTQVLASAMGGYLAGRLRTKWADLHTDEVYFRDTAHGFLAWAVASLATAALLSSVIASILGGGVQAGAALTGAAAGVARSAPDNNDGPMGYFIDSLFRHDAVTPENTDRFSSKDTAEVGRIFMNVSRAEPLPAEDIRYVGQIVAQRTGLSQQSAEKRVADIYAQAQAKARDVEMAARAAADKARKASAYSALWLFISLLVGAFVASLAATFGGRRRDA
jgi:hypothetical protein